MSRKRWPLWVILATLVLVPLLLWGVVVLPPRRLDTRGLGVEQRLKAENDLRSTLATLVAGLAVIAGAIVAAINIVLTQRVQWRGQVTKRFTKAIEQLGQSGPDKVDIRIGAAYALEQIAQDSPELQWPIMEVLTACLREHARLMAPAADVDEESSEPADAHVPADHQAIATVIGRRRQEHDPFDQSLDLQGVDLSYVQWDWAQLAGANLSEARLKGANLYGAQLSLANLGGAHLEGANLTRAHLQGADLDETHLDRANLDGANLARATLTTAHGVTLAQLERALNSQQANPPEHLSREYKR